MKMAIKLARPTTQVENAFVFESADPLFQLTEQCHVYIAPLIFRVTASVVCGKRIPAFLRLVRLSQADMLVE